MMRLLCQGWARAAVQVQQLHSLQRLAEVRLHRLLILHRLVAEAASRNDQSA